MVLNQSENCNYDQNLVWFNKTRNRVLCVDKLSLCIYLRNFCRWFVRGCFETTKVAKFLFYGNKQNILKRLHKKIIFSSKNFVGQKFQRLVRIWQFFFHFLRIYQNLLWYILQYFGTKIENMTQERQPISHENSE